MDFSAGQSVAACLSDELLSDFVGGRLSDLGLEEQLAEHLASCDTCALRLQTLPRDPLCELLRAEDPLGLLGNSGQLRSDHSLTSTDALLPSDSDLTSRRDTLAAIACCPELPVKIGSYFVIRLLGQGGFGDVYLARDPLHNRLVAIKVPRADRFVSRESRQAFLKEARTAAELDHPHIVSTYDCCELEDGRCIVVMEYIEGTTLRELMRSQRLDHARGATIVAQIAEALDYAHQRGIWHRDVKPANILLDRDGTPYLSDFGLAVHEDQQPLLGDDLAGTYPYMSPEQILGQTSRLDGRSDIWSLGVILYELLAGERPFRGSTYDELKEEIPSRIPQVPRLCDATIDENLEQACLTCLEPDPDRRFATAAELAEQLRQRPDRQRSRLRPLYVAAALSLAVLAGLTVAGLASRDWRPSPQPTTLRPIAWATVEPTDFFKVDPNTNRIAIKSSANYSCFETHRPATNHYTLHASGEFLGNEDAAGLVVGIDPTSITPPQYGGTLIFVGRNFADWGSWLHVGACQFALDGRNHMDLRGDAEIALLKLDDLAPRPFSLAIEVRRERIVSVRYNDRRLPDVEAALRDHKILSKTTCGIMAQGHIVFHTLRCEEIKND